MTDRQQTTWEDFCRTGKVEDYLHYRRDASVQPGAATEETPDAANTGGDRPASVQG